jgi:hypothetical protein
MPIMDGFESTTVIQGLYKSMKIMPPPYIVGIGGPDFNERG